MRFSALVPALLCVAVGACTSSNQSSETNDSVAGVSEPVSEAPEEQQAATERCFLRTEGLQNQDTTFISLNLDGEEVSGEMRWVPFEKDARRGTLSGKRSDSTITATWTYMQEGMTDSLQVQFVLEGDRLVQKSADTKDAVYQATRCRE
jgi:hypothetical protein